MECPIGTVMSRIYRGRKILHKLLYEHARELGMVVEGDPPAGERESTRARPKKQNPGHASQPERSESTEQTATADALVLADYRDRRRDRSKNA
jgi:RNA polymerase sigma-70 factor (ECF subfamily)